MRKNLQAFLVYFALAVILTWPLLPHITTHYPSTVVGDGGDPNMYVWFMTSVAEKIAHPSFHPGQMLFYPTGMNLLASYEAPIILPIGVPIILATHNGILAYNLILLMAFILTAYCCYLLILYLTGSFWVSLVTGFSFGFSPYMMVRSVQHLDLLFLFTIVLVVLFGLKAMENPSRKNLVWLVFSVFLTALSAWYYLIGSLMFLVILGLFRFRFIWQNKKSWIYAIIAMGVLCLAVALPLILNRSSASLAYVNYLVDKRGADPANFFLPHSFIQPWTLGIYSTFYSPFEATSYFGLVGVIAILVLLFPRVFKIPHRGLWITMMILFTVIAIGTRWDLSNGSIWMPFSLLRKIVPFDHLRAPNRFFVFAYLAATIVFGYFLAQMQRWYGGKRIFWMLGAILLILLASERVMFPYPLYTIRVSEFYKTLGADPGNFAIVDIPLVDPGRSLFDYYQLYHHKPIVDGEYFWTAYNTHTFDFINRNRLLDFVFTNPCSEVVPLKPELKAKALKQLSDNNVKYVVVHNLLFRYDDCAQVGGFVHEFFEGQKPVFADGEITVYATKP